MSWLWVCDRCLLLWGREGACSCILGLSTLYVDKLGIPCWGYYSTREKIFGSSAKARVCVDVWGVLYHIILSRSHWGFFLLKISITRPSGLGFSLAFPPNAASINPLSANPY